MQRTLIIVGASARAAAQSAVRAAYRVWAADLFADADLRACADAVRVDDYPRGLLRALRDAPDADWLFTGALENHPRLVDRIAGTRRLLGCPGDVLRHVRSPRRLAAALRSAGLRFPETRFDGYPAEETGQWLIKPFRSAGGARIRLACAGDNKSGNTRRGRRSHYFQRLIAGTPSSAVFVADGRRATLLGATQQLIGCAWTGAGGYQYCGSIGPLDLSASSHHEIGRIGHYLAERFRLVGLFGVDFLLAGDEVWTLEVNPRYTASIEVLEHALDVRAIELHVSACRERELPPDIARAARHSCVGKAIVFAAAPLRVSEADSSRWMAQSQASSPIRLADIPPPGTVIEAGHPVFTVFSQGGTLAEVESDLRQCVANALERV